MLIYVKHTRMMKVFAIILLFVAASHAFDSEQLEVFDAVEEIKENFYTLLNISQDATDREIKQAYRSLTLKLHPDKNLDVDTSVQFRNLVSVYEVLRSPAKRKYYNEVLVNGLPNWRSAVYYYRYVRKMGMAEACIILFIIITIGQYLVNWGAYFEKLYTIEQNRKRKSRRDKSEVIIEIPKPSFKDTLPVQIPCLIWFTITSIPHSYKVIKDCLLHQLEEMKTPKVEEVIPEVPKVKTIRKRNKGFVLPEGSNIESLPSFAASNVDVKPVAAIPIVSGGLWTDDDLTELIKLVKKFPGGTPGRWEIIAEALCRSVPEITFMANKMKENGYKMPSEQSEETIPEPKVKQKTKKADIEATAENQAKKWNQIHQKALEEALAKYPKGCMDRWDRISEAVPNKTKEECMLRFRYLADVLRKQKESTESKDAEVLRPNEE